MVELTDALRARLVASEKQLADLRHENYALQSQVENFHGDHAGRRAPDWRDAGSAAVEVEQKGSGAAVVFEADLQRLQREVRDKNAQLTLLHVCSLPLCSLILL